MHLPNNEDAILARVIQPDRDDFPLAAARVLLKLEVGSDDRQRMHELAVKNQEGKLSSTERKELDGYLRIGRLIDLLSARARLSLKKRGRTS